MKVLEPILFLVIDTQINMVLYKIYCVQVTEWSHKIELWSLLYFFSIQFLKFTNGNIYKMHEEYGKVNSYFQMRNSALLTQILQHNKIKL